MSEDKNKAPERVWITWDDAYPWPTPEMGGDEYVRADLINSRVRVSGGVTENDEAVIKLLLDWRKWYSEDIFSPWTVKEAQRVHTEFPNAVDRIAADSARGTIDHIIEDIRAGKHHVSPVSGGSVSPDMKGIES